MIQYIRPKYLQFFGKWLVGWCCPLSCFDLRCNHLFIILLAQSCQMIYNFTLMKNKRPEMSPLSEIWICTDSQHQNHKSVQGIYWILFNVFFPYCSISELPMFMKCLLNSSTYVHKFTLGLFVLQWYIISYEDRNSSLHKSSPHPQSLNLKMPKIMITILFMYRIQFAIKSLYCVPTQKYSYRFTMILNCL